MKKIDHLSDSSSSRLSELSDFPLSVGNSSSAQAYESPDPHLNPIVDIRSDISLNVQDHKISGAKRQPTTGID